MTSLVESVTFQAYYQGKRAEIYYSAAQSCQTHQCIESQLHTHHNQIFDVLCCMSQDYKLSGNQYQSGNDNQHHMEHPINLDSQPVFRRHYQLHLYSNILWIKCWKCIVQKTTWLHKVHELFQPVVTSFDRLTWMCKMTAWSQSLGKIGSRNAWVF